LTNINANLIDVTSDRLRSFGMCWECRRSVRVSQRAAASKFWDELPSIFELPPWPELQAMKRAAMGEEEEEDDEDEDEDDDE
jgi:hypothetical protein